MLDREAAQIPRGALWLTCGLALIFAGCLSSQGPEPVRRLAWPEPPLTARIEHVRTIRSGYDLQVAAPSAWDRFVNYLLGSNERFLPIAHPVDLELSPNGNVLYVSDFAQGVVHVLDLELNTAGTLGGDERFQRPFGLATDSQGRIYLVEQGTSQIRVLDPSGRTLAIFQSDELIRPTDIEIDESRGRLYVADPSHQQSPNHHVHVFDLEGNYLHKVGHGKGTGEGWLMFPTYLALGADGELYVTDTLNSRVSVFSPDGEFLRVVGSRGDGYGQFDKPKGVALDHFQNLYVADSSWSNVQIFGPEGDTLLYFGGRGAHPALLRNPTALTISAQTNTIYVGDYLNHRVVVYQLINTERSDGVAGSAVEEEEKETEGGRKP